MSSQNTIDWSPLAKNEYIEWNMINTTRIPSGKKSDSIAYILFGSWVLLNIGLAIYD